ncbi:DUF1254 domain-containing protein [Cellulomonas hominis]|uniref:DUF1254 domain-containing protein n=1 Tax=Cellulomonas hominis TaxID=156981 RepID=UPI001B90EF50|nr:DUF1254 domain-containing protein [Cellulomonas hominis]VTR75536.1 hypothetical protein CHMI_00283 [Cellulomonas hominis]
MTDELEDLAAEGYLYAFPLVFNLDQVLRYATTGVGSVPGASWNTFGHARRLAGPDDTFVTINNDTVYSMAQIDVGAGPVRLEVPDTAGRYYVLQLVDAWTNNFAYVGKRATGTGAGAFLLVAPDWDGVTPDDATVIRFPTRVASVVGRWAVSGPDDLPAVHALQDATTLTPADPSAPSPRGLPEVTATGDEVLDFWERYRVWSQELPPAGRDRPRQAALAPLGLTGDRPVHTLDPAVQQALREGHRRGRAVLEATLTSGHSPVVNGWHLTLHAFDYNADFFEVGALDDPEFVIGDPTLRVVERAAAALGGLWGNHAYEAAYVMTYVDDHGDPLTGDRTYTLTLAPPPPVDGFWSVTMYDVPDFFLVANPADRYSVGDRTPGLVRDRDGGLTITMSHSRPADPDAAANWLPAPEGPFRPVLRMYVPRAPVLDGTYRLPPVVRVG